MDDTKCLIDNWSLEYAARLLDRSDDIYGLNDDQFKNAIGSLSNYINSLLLYSTIYYTENGFEDAWRSYNWFAKNSMAYINPLNTEQTLIDWHNEESYNDNGIQNYLITSQFYNCDLFVSPERSSKIISDKNTIQKLNSRISATLKEIDDKINLKKSESWYKDIKIGVSDNFMLPSLTHYVLSEATSADDLLTVIMQLKSSGKIDRINQEIYDYTSTTKKSFQFQNDIENIINSHFGKSYTKNWSLGFSAWFLSVSKSFDFSFFNRKEHIVFLKDVIKTRVEVSSLEKDIQRIFNRKIK